MPPLLYSPRRRLYLFRARQQLALPTAAVVITFFVFWAPFHAQRLLFLHGQNWQHYKTVNEWLFLFGGTLYYVSW